MRPRRRGAWETGALASKGPAERLSESRPVFAHRLVFPSGDPLGLVPRSL